MVNSGALLFPPSQTHFYWSLDSILDVTDAYLGQKTENQLNPHSEVWTSFIYTKPTLTEGRYFIIYVLDSLNVAVEHWENTNKGYFTLYQQPGLTLPYFNDFETEIDGWRHNESLGLDEWEWAEPNGTNLNQTFSGTKCWITNDTGAVSPMTRMHLYTPVFNFSASLNPVLQFDMILDCDDGADDDGTMNMSYSIDGGATWMILDTTSQSYNRWYYPMKENGGGSDGVDDAQTDLLFVYEEGAFASVHNYNGRDVRINTRYILDIGFLAGKPSVQFRYNFATKDNLVSNTDFGLQKEGALIDNFVIKEKETDLLVTYKKNLMIASNAQTIRFEMAVFNAGNYYSSPGIVRFYLSTDSLFDASDALIGQNSYGRIRPFFSGYINSIQNAPANLSNFSYLIYKIDVQNSTPETDEINNIGYWPLSLDSINSYPYVQDFNDTIIHGWTTYAFLVSPMSHISNSFRLRNMKVPEEIRYQFMLESGHIFNDRINFTTPTSVLPVLYLESPSFNFVGADSISVSFDQLMIGGGNDQGGNLEYTVNGGTTWNLLSNSTSQNYNWYNQSALSYLFSEPGWGKLPPSDTYVIMDSSWANISHLRNTENVVFRFKYRSKLEPFGSDFISGVHIDNFRIESFTSDYHAIDPMQSISITNNQSTVSLNYNVANVGQTNGRLSQTGFYWSIDNVLDTSDLFLGFYPISAVPMGSVQLKTSTINLNPPTPLGMYYIIYYIDDMDNIVETDELNNVSLFEVTVEDNTSVDENNIQFNIYSDGYDVFIDAKNQNGTSGSVELYDGLGKKVFTTNVLLNSGLNKILLSKKISSGIYYLTYTNNNIFIREKIYLIGSN